MARTSVVTGAASGIGAATKRWLAERGERVIGCDLHDADVIADLTTPAGRSELIASVTRLSGGRIDAIVANAGGGPAETSVSLNFFGAVATLDGLRPLLRGSAAPRAVAVSSIASLRPPHDAIAAACLRRDESTAIRLGRQVIAADAEAPLTLYGSAKHALQIWCRSQAATPEWAGAGILLNVVALGFYDTPAAAYVLSNPDSRAAAAQLVPLRGAFPGRPAEAASLLAWCVSADNAQLTGQILFADGGFECSVRGKRPA
jgi:NAD(P)-dependent dehydrogenase (short-subunit alcohol dehydrogenase family)